MCWAGSLYHSDESYRFPDRLIYSGPARVAIYTRQHIRIRKNAAGKLAQDSYISRMKTDFFRIYPPYA